MDKHHTTTDPYREALQLFVYDKNDGIRPEFRTPLLEEGFAIATDVYTLIAIPQELLQSTEGFGTYKKGALKVIPEGENMCEIYDVEFLKEKIAHIRKKEAKRYKMVGTHCPDCNDTKIVTWTFFDYDGDEILKQFRCPTCEDGKTFKNHLDNKSGYIVSDYNVAFTIQEVYIDVKFMERMVRVADLLGAGSIELTQKTSSTRPIKFQIKTCTIAVMPMIDIDEKNSVIQSLE